MKAGEKMFRAVAALVEAGLSPSRAAKVLRLSPDTASRWRREHPDFAAMLDEAESKFIAEMTACLAAAAKTDWRAAEALLARRFPAEFARDGAAVQFALNVGVQPQESLDDAIAKLKASPAARKMLRELTGEMVDGPPGQCSSGPA